jgi:hypothetical protein
MYMNSHHLVRVETDKLPAPRGESRLLERPVLGRLVGGMISWGEPWLCAEKSGVVSGVALVLPTLHANLPVFLGEEAGRLVANVWCSSAAAPR